jgi:lysyl-tRNA synthetase, class II
LALDEKIYEQRREKLKQIEALGQRAYPSRFGDPTMPTIGKIRDQHAQKTAAELESARPRVQLAGRVMSIRVQGRAGFATLQGEARRKRTGRRQLQIYVRMDAVGEETFKLFKLLDIGDYVGVKGYLFRTRTDELTVHVEELSLLSKALLPLPEKWHGLADVELRYRQRYLDLLMNPATREIFIKRSRLIQSLRSTLDREGFIEVETPMMQPIAGGAVAKPFVTHHNTLDMDLYLRIAPELYLKRLLVGGLGRVYEINRNFRNEGISTRHNPEFTMLEFYQAYADFRDVMNLTQKLIVNAVTQVTGHTRTKWGEQEIDWAESNWRRMTMREAIIHYWPERAGAKPAMSDFATHDSVKALVQRFNSGHAHVAYDPAEPTGKTIASLFEAAAEEHLIQPTIIYEFPTAVSPLSKQKPDEPDWTERWEIFVGAMEIANGFSELNDPEDQRQRFEQQLKERERGDEEAHQMDYDYIRALSYGMPPAGGCGVGVDRLAMLLTDSRTIRDVILFPLLRPEKSSTTEDTEDAKKDLSS